MVEELLQYPCEIDIKIFVKSGENNNKLISEVLALHITPEHILNISQRKSRNNRYQSFSCKVNAQSKQQMDAFYQYLSTHPDVIMAL